MDKKYLDFDTMSTTKLHPEVLDTYQELLNKYYANSESRHDLGREVARLLEQARHHIASLLKIKDHEVIFTSGASEANNTAIKGYAFANQHKGKHLITTQIEHASVLNSFKQLETVFGFEVTYLPVNQEGVITVDTVKSAIRPDTILVSTMFINNEVGSIQPITEIGELLKNYPKIAFHVDLVQGVGKYLFNLENIDMATLSAHKIHGLKGSGVLVKKSNIEILPLIVAGSQEHGLRGGTSNALVHVMFAKTLRMALSNQKNSYQTVKKLYDHLRQRLGQLAYVTINSPDDGSVFLLNISLSTITSEVLMNALNDKGILVSAASTCSAKLFEPSYVLKAMGIKSEFLNRSLRIGLQPSMTIDDIDYLVDSIEGIVKSYGNI